LSRIPSAAWGVVLGAAAVAGVARGEPAPKPAETAKPAEAPVPKEADRPEIVVTGTREPSEALLVPSHVTLITAEEIERAGWRDVAEALAAPPGLFARRNSSTPQDITLDLRGFNNGGGNGQHLLVLVDGRKTNGVTGSTTDWAAIPLENIERIEIVRGPAAALYGDTALGGVIHILTKDGAADPVRSLSAGLGSFGTSWERIFLSGRTGDLGYAAFGRTERSDGFRDNSDYDAWDATGKLDYDLGSDWRLRGKAGYHEDHRRRPGSLSKAEIDQYGREASVTPDDRSTVFTSNADLGLERREEVFFKGAGTITTRSAAFATWTNNRTDSHITYPGSGDATTFDDSDLLNLTLQHTSAFRLLDPDARDLKVTVGTDLGYEVSDADALNNFPPFFVQDQTTTYKRRLIGIFGHAELAVTDGLALSGGIRFDRALFNFRQETEDLVFGGTTEAHTNTDFDQWNPHAGVNYRWSATTSTYLSYGRTLRYPNRDELVGFLLAAPELRPERATTWEIGAREEWGREFTGSIALYRMDVQDEIYYVPPPGGVGFGANENLPRVRHQGVELAARGEIAPPVSAYVTYACTRTAIVTGPYTGNRMPVTPMHEAMGGIDVTVTEGVVLVGRVRYTGVRYLINDIENERQPLPDYATFDIGARFQRGMFKAWATAFNVSNRMVFDNGGIRFTGAEAFNPAPGVNYEVGTQVDF
jgi:iron complex outermembrane receptor protein